jgi:hypothetical protein
MLLENVLALLLGPTERNADSRNEGRANDLLHEFGKRKALSFHNRTHPGSDTL